MPLFSRPPPPTFPGYAGLGALAAEGWRVLALAAVIPLLRLALHTTLFEPAARAAMRLPRSGPLSAPEAKRVSKFAESAWKCGAYAVLSALGVAALAGSPWAPSPLGAPGTTLAAARAAVWATRWPAAVALTPAAARYWTAQAAFYASSMASLFVWEHRRSDFRVMVAHHLTTAALIGGAALTRLEAPGIVVAALHDPADVFLEGAKVASYAGLDAVATLSFVALVLTWAVTRLGVLPLVAADTWRAARSGGARGTGIPAARPLSILLWALVAMHCYWFGLIARIAAGQLVRGRVTRDVRETTEEEEEGGGGGGVEVKEAVDGK